MSTIGKKLRMAKDDAGGVFARFWCPGCEKSHLVRVQGEGSWGFNGSVHAPTFTPSVLVTSGHYIPGHFDNECWCKYNAARPGQEKPFECTACHSFVTDGRIQFCPDSTHAMAGQTVDLPDWPDTQVAA